MAALTTDVCCAPVTLSTSFRPLGGGKNQVWRSGGSRGVEDVHMFAEDMERYVDGIQSKALGIPAICLGDGPHHLHFLVNLGEGRAAGKDRQ